MAHIELRPPRDESDARTYPRSIPALSTLTRLALHPKVTFLVGENGSGKSTILEALAVGVGLNPEGGSRNFNFATHNSHSNLCDALTVARTAARPADHFFLRAESFFNVATEVERLGVGGYGDIPLHAQSHGESFFALLQNRFRGPGLYLLDEPEAALSPQRQLAFIAILHQHIVVGSQFVIATHSPIILAYPNSKTYLLEHKGIRSCAYRETDQFRVTRAFLENPELSIRELLREDES